MHDTAAKKRLIVISNRLPISVSRRGKKLRYQPSVGGLATGLGSLMESSYEGLWFGWPGIASDKLSANEKGYITRHLRENDCHPVFLSQHELDTYYSGFCNKTIWPLFHYFTQYAVYDKLMWNAYYRVNRRFCDEVAPYLKDGDIVWVHDYQLLLLPRMLRELDKDISIGFFLHIPFPSFEVFRLLPWRREVLEGLLGADLIGFHTYDYVRHFLSSVRNRLGYEHTLGEVTVDNRVVKVDTFPMGIDAGRYRESSSLPEVQKEMEKFKKRIGAAKMILSVDRLDYSKGILHRLRSYDLFLDKYPRYKEKVVLILVAVPSRTKVEHYRQLKRELDELVGNINGKHGQIGWSPVSYLYTSLPFHSLTALYNLADVALVTPIRDGMNLIAKEYIASKKDGRGVLILSEMAGAAKELSEAVIVNPNNIERIADSIKFALTMSPKEEVERNTLMKKRIDRYDVKAWADYFMKSLEAQRRYEQELSARILGQRYIDTLLDDYRTSTNRLIFLDYDGTMTPFSTQTARKKPDNEVLSLLRSLSSTPKNNVFLVSGRDRHTLSAWFGELPVGMIAEHGVWVREPAGEWQLIEPLLGNWKQEIRPILERYMDRTPGSQIEEKDYSLVWHYRKVNQELAGIRARELKEELVNFTSNLGIGVLEGSKIIEIKNAGINKGLAALKWLSEGIHDFILAAGDDKTDEDLFAVLPPGSYSIKVGLPPTMATYTVPSVKQIRLLINKMSEVMHDTH